MMFVDNITEEFYLEIKGKRVLVVVNYDVDAICACKILQTLFKNDYTLYTLVPVDVSSDLKKSVKDNRLDEKYIIFINCGGTVDLVEELELDNDDITFFVVDSHRPLDVCNIYNPSQVKLLVPTDAVIPEFQDIFSGDEDEESNEDNDDDDDDDIDDDVDDDDEDENPEKKRQRLTEEDIIKRRNKRLWHQRRNQILFDYTKFGYYGRSSSLVMYEMAWKMSKDTFDILWYAVVGLSEQFLMRKIGEQDYISECGDVQSHIARLTHRFSEAADQGRNAAIRIEFEKDLRIALFRHWTVKSSLTYSAFTATRLKLWSFQGEKRLHEMLAEIGIPLIQCNQKYSSMDLIFRKEFQGSLEKMTEKYSLDGLVFVSFLMQHGFRAKYSAMDYVYGLIGLLQSHSEERPQADCFLECLEALCRTKKERLDQGIDIAKKIVTSVFKQVQNALETKQILSTGPFLYFILQEGNADATLCNHPYGIFLLADFALRAYAASSKTSKSRTLPLIVSTPCMKDKCSEQETKEDALCHIAGVVALARDKNVNYFGKAFMKASETSASPIQAKYFDSAVIKIKVKDRTRFLDALAILLNEG